LPKGLPSDEQAHQFIEYAKEIKSIISKEFGLYNTKQNLDIGDIL
jgi:hypothetical protein